MTDFSITYSAQDKTSKIRLLLDGRHYLVELNPLHQNGEDVETFYPKQLAISSPSTIQTFPLLLGKTSPMIPLRHSNASTSGISKKPCRIS